MSSTSPLNGKLSQILTPRISIFASTIILGIGTLITAFANNFAVFIAGRAVTGVGAAGIYTVSIIIVIDLSTPKRRGLFMGLLNSGFTIGVAAGATIAGALLPAMGWRALFWLQMPIAVVSGITLFTFMPGDFGKTKNDGSGVLSRLAKLDYFGAVSLVRFDGIIVTCVLADGHTDCGHHFHAVCALITQRHTDFANRHIDHCPGDFYSERDLRRQRSDHSSHPTQVSRIAIHMSQHSRIHDVSMDRPVLFSHLRHSSTRLVSRNSRIHPHPHKPWLRNRWSARRLATHPPQRQFLHVRPLTPPSPHPPPSLPINHRLILLAPHS